MGFRIEVTIAPSGTLEHITRVMDDRSMNPGGKRVIRYAPTHGRRADEKSTTAYAARDATLSDLITLLNTR